MSYLVIVYYAIRIVIQLSLSHLLKKSLCGTSLAKGISPVCSCHVERKGAVGQGLLEKILLAVVAAVLRASTMLLQLQLLLLLLLRKHSSRVHKQADKTKGEEEEERV